MKFTPWRPALDSRLQESKELGTLKSFSSVLQGQSHASESDSECPAGPRFVRGGDLGQFQAVQGHPQHCRGPQQTGCSCVFLSAFQYLLIFVSVCEKLRQDPMILFTNFRRRIRPGSPAVSAEWEQGRAVGPDARGADARRTFPKVWLLCKSCFLNRLCQIVVCIIRQLMKRIFTWVRLLSASKRKGWHTLQDCRLGSREL